MTRTFMLGDTEHRLTVSDTLHLTCTKDGANKFWSACTGTDLDPKTPMESKEPYVVVLTWGRIGTQGQSQFKRFRFAAQAEQYVSGRVRDKVNKGYVSNELRTVGVIAQAAAVPYTETEWDLL